MYVRISLILALLRLQGLLKTFSTPRKYINFLNALLFFSASMIDLLKGVRGEDYFYSSCIWIKFYLSQYFTSKRGSLFLYPLSIYS